jgi:hypothetical protein
VKESLMREKETSVVEMFRGEKKDGKEWKGRKLVIKLVFFFSCERK